MDLSCCLPRQRCENRDSWVSIRDVEGKNNTATASYPVPILSLFGLYTAMGNANFLDEKYHSCKMSNERVERC